MSNKEKVASFMKGMVRAEVFDEAGNLVSTHFSKNTITTAGFARMIDMLIDGYDSGYPYASSNNPVDDISMIHDYNSFAGANYDGEIFGVNVAEWPARQKSSFKMSGTYVSDAYIKNAQGAFSNNLDSFTELCSFDDGTCSINPGNDWQQGWICDLGIDTVSYTKVVADNNYFNLNNKNIKYGSIEVKNSSGTTLTPATDYLFTIGDMDNYGTLKIISSDMVGQTISISYKWYDVPTVPIVGVMLDWAYNGNGYRNSLSFISYSLNQGKSRTMPVLPNYSGTMRHPGNIWNGYNGTWGADKLHVVPQSQRREYCYTHLPWAVKNPTQLAFFGNSYAGAKYLNNIQLLTYKMPKPGIHAMALGTGTGTTSATDTSLFSKTLAIPVYFKGYSDTTKFVMEGYVDFNQGNDQTITEVGLCYPSKDDIYFKSDNFYNNSISDGGCGVHNNHISGNAKIYKLGNIETEDCDILATHALFDTPITKNSSRRVRISYEFNMTW
jgi:hypothetical protein